MNRRNIITLIAILGFMLILVVGGIIIFEGDKESSHKIDKPNDTIQNAKKTPQIKIFTTKNLEPNIKPQFKVGDKFEYEVTSNFVEMGIEGPHTYKRTTVVEKIERVNGIDTYVLVDPGSEDPNALYTYIDKNTGKIIQSKLKLVYPDGHVEEDDMDAGTIFNNQYVYADWMLALDDGLKWELNITTTEKKRIYPELTDEQSRELMREMARTGKSLEEILNIPVSIVKTTNEYEFEVEEIEKIKVRSKERDCFKVVRIEKEGDKIVGDKIIMWVDAEKRILVKKEAWIENLRMLDMNLISEL